VKGRTPKPGALKMMLGNVSKQRSNYSNPLPSLNIREPSEWMTGEQQAVWSYLVAHAPPGMLKQLDRYPLEVYVGAVVAYQHAAIELAKETDPLTERAQCYQALLIRQARIMRQYGEVLGFSPAARPRIQLTPEPDAEKSELEKLMA
jgi:hypothetical protein